MPQKCETRAVGARESRNSCGRLFRDLYSALVLQVQFPMAGCRVGPGDLRAELYALPIYPCRKIGEVTA